MTSQLEQTIAGALSAHGVIIIPGIQADRAKCRCGWSAIGPGVTVEARTLDHQAAQVVEAIQSHVSDIARDAATEALEILDAEIVEEP